MEKSNILLITGGLILSLLTVLTGCGGGGADTSRSGGTDATLAESNARQAGDAAVQAVRLVAPATLGQVKAGSVSSTKRAPLMAIFQNIAPVIGKQAANGKQSSSLFSQPCHNGGNIEVTSVSPDGLSGNVKADVNVNNCKIASETMNGVLTMTLPADQASDPLHATEFTIEVSSFTYSDSTTSLSLTDNFTMVARNFTYDGDDLSSGSVTLGGTVSATINGGAINMVCDSLGLQFVANSSGISVSVSGRVNASCLGGWVTLSTTQNQPVFVPSNATCPTSGNIIVSSGGSSVTMSIESSSGINIYFNGTLIQHYTDCNGVIGLCTG